MKKFWMSPWGKAFRQLYLVAIGAAVLAVLNEIPKLDVSPENYFWWGIVLAVLKALDSIIRTAICNAIGCSDDQK